MSFGQQPRRHTPAPIGVSPFVADNGSSGGFGLNGGTRFSLSAAPSLQARGGASHAAPSTPHHLRTSGPASSPFASSPYAQSPASPTSSNASPRSPGGAQSSPSPSPSPVSASWATAGAGWGSSVPPMSPPRASTNPYGQTSSHGGGGWGGGAPSPSSQASYAAPTPSPSLHQRTPSSSRASSGGIGIIGGGGVGGSLSGGYSATAPSSSSVPRPSATASAAKFSHPDLERIAHRLQMVAQHKTLSNLLLYSGALLCALLLLLYLLVKQLPVTVDIGVMGLRMAVARDWVHGLGALAVALMAYLGASGLHLYATLQPPLQEIEQLSERQRALMGWSTGAANGRGGAATATSQRYLDSQAPEERMHDRNAMRARARVQQLTGAAAANAAAANAAATASSRTPSSLRSGAHGGSGASSALARALSPVPASSLRFLGASGSPLASRHDSPYGGRGSNGGLDTPAGGGGGMRLVGSPVTPAGGPRIHDEASLGHWAREFDVQRSMLGRQGGGGVGSGGDAHATPGHHSNHSLHASSFHTPAHAHSASHLSPRGGGGHGGFGGLFGGFGVSSLGAHTPPYATSMRESPAIKPTSSPFGLGASAGALGLGSHGVQGVGIGGGGTGLGGGGAAGARSTFSFALPGHRFALDDPRSDADLHDSFDQSLRSLRTTPAQLDAWARSLRAWVVAQVLRPLLRALDDSNVALARFAGFVLAQPGVAQAFRPEELAMLRELSHAYAGHSLSSLPPLSARLAEAVALLCTRFPTRAEALQRAPIDKFLAVEHHVDSATASAQHQHQAAPAGFGLSSFGGIGGGAQAAGTGAAGGSSGVSHSTRAFVSQRLHALCGPGDDALSKFMLSGSGGLGVGLGAVAGAGARRTAGLFGTRSSGGGAMPSSSASAPVVGGAGAVVSPFPSDAQIVLHCLCVHMEGVQPGFRSRFVKEWDGCTLSHAHFSSGGAPAGPPGARSPSAAVEHVSIAQVRPPSMAPYFVLVASAGAREGVKLVTEPGRASLFQSLALWVLHLPKGSPLLREFAGAGISMSDR